MIRTAPFAGALAAIFLLAGCADYGHGRYPDTRTSRPGPRADTRPAPTAASAEWRRVETDARRYTDALDRQLRREDRRLALDARQKNRIEGILLDRTYTVLQRTDARNHPRIYPFPRNERLRDNAAFWRGTDGQIERVLDRQQRDAYRYLVQQTRQDDRRGRDDGQRGRVRGPR